MSSNGNQNIDPRLIIVNKVDTNVSLTRLSGAPGARLTKRFYKNEQGQIQKESQPRFSNGEAETITLKKLSDIAGIVNSLDSHQAIATGIFDVAKCPIVTKSNFSVGKYESGVRTRSKEHMSQPDLGVILLDYDSDSYMPESMRCKSPDELMDKLIKAIPEFNGIAYTSVGSSSNGIFDEKTEAPYSGGGGIHIYIAVKGIELDLLRQLMKVKLWNADLGYLSYARHGAMLERTLFDMSVLSPERLVYEAKPILGKGVGQKERVWTHVDGKVFTDAVMLTDEETTQYERLVADARKNPAAIEISDNLQNGHRKKQIDRLIKEKNISHDEAEKQIPNRSQAELTKTTQILGLNESIEIDGRMMLVSDIVARGEEFDGKSMPDPIEGSSYGPTTAMYYHNDGKDPCIHSFAHGVKTVYKIQVKQQDSFVKCATEIIPHKPVNLSEPLDAGGFPHTINKKDGSCKPKCTIENVEHLLNGYGITTQYDVIGKETVILIPGISGITENASNTAIECINSLATLNNMPIGQVPRYVAVIADRNAINPVAVWITGRDWDGIDRVQALCNTLTPRDDFPDDFKDILTSKWLTSAVAAATIPSGFHARGILTFQGAQGLGKTSWFRLLMPEGLLRDKSILTGHHLDPSNKDSLTTAIKNWLVEIGEIDSSFRKDVARLKGFTTQATDSVRRPYARTNSDYQRRTVFCASVNEENFLIDKTGNSRFWTIPLVKIDYQHDIDMQQVFAQLNVELQKGATWWLTQEEDKQLDELNQAHKSVSVIEELILSILNHDLSENKWKKMSAADVLKVAGIRSPTNPQARECGSVLRGLYGQPKKIRGIMKWLVPIDINFTRID